MYVGNRDLDIRGNDACYTKGAQARGGKGDLPDHFHLLQVLLYHPRMICEMVPCKTLV